MYDNLNMSIDKSKTLIIDDWQIDNIDWIKSVINRGVADRRIIFIRKEIICNLAKLLINRELNNIKKKDNVSDRIAMNTLLNSYTVENIYDSLNNMDLLGFNGLLQLAISEDIDINSTIDRYRLF